MSCALATAMVESEVSSAVLAAIRDEVANELEFVFAARQSVWHSELESLKSRLYDLESCISGESLRPQTTSACTVQAVQCADNIPVVALPDVYLSLPLQDATDKDKMRSDDAEIGGMPESFVAYCLTKLVVSESWWTEPALRMLVSFVAFHQLIIMAFIQASQMNHFLVYKHWAGQSGDKAPFDHCMMANRVIHGDPLMIYIVGFAACFMVSLSIKAHSEQYLSALYPRREDGFALWSMASVVWLVQTIYVPAIFCLQAGLILAGSGDSSEIVMNALAVTFLLEFDDMVYSGLLTERDREEYQAIAESFVAIKSMSDAVDKVTFQHGIDFGNAAAPPRLVGERLATKHVTTSANRIFLSNVVFMTLLFVIDRTRHAEFLGYVKGLYSIAPPVWIMTMFTRIFFQLWEWHGCSSHLSIRKVICVSTVSILAVFILIVLWDMPLGVLISGSHPFLADYAELLTLCLGLPASETSVIAGVISAR